ncbi:ABC transporter ATP-binding protein [Flavobacterium columnare]|uniref:ABC transporter ATP-binding protein n=1 Tax=Flavobacterium columnare TaxID=996 RepID=UPI001BC890DD|nr:ABC transporter ATP-binding protein [Flavobacterium columnare]AUX17117.1 ABC transporter ATP-binding protein [Flavobacterium columnare]
MIQVKNISFGYTDTAIIKAIDFEVQRGQNIALIGESGCGKSTLLKLIYGLYDVNEGSLFWNETPITGPKQNLVPGMPFMKYMAQDFGLMPYETVSESVGKFLSNQLLAIKRLRIQELLDIVEMGDFSRRKVSELSGGQQQRVALARVLALEPEVLLLDEPFSHIDNFRKNALRRNLFAYLKTKEITVIIATHDSTDALAFADETIVLRGGELVVKAPSKEIYTDPKNKYVASLFGEVNELVINKNGLSETILLYPHQLRVSEEGQLKATVKQCYYKGGYYLIKAAFNGRPIFFEHRDLLELQLDVSLEVLI